MNRLIIVGASGHGKVVADIAKLVGYSDIVFLDDNDSISNCNGYPVLGNISLLNSNQGDVFVAIGNPSVRKSVMNQLSDRNIPVLIHPNSVVAKDVIIGKGTVVMAGAVINPCVEIGVGSIINTCSSVDHDCNLGDYVHIAVGAHVCGTVKIGDGTWVGAGSTIINNISIYSGCMIGAGSVVVKDITDSGKYFGVPARRKG